MRLVLNLRPVVRHWSVAALLGLAAWGVPSPASGEPRLVAIEPPPLSNVVTVRGVSGNGGVVVGGVTQRGSPVRAYRWTETGGMVLLPNPDGRTRAVAAAANLDGSVVVGIGFGPDPQSQNLATRWNLDGSIGALAPLVEGAWSEAYGVSADGAFVAGQRFGVGVVSGVRWNGAGAALPLGPLAGGDHSYGRGVSGDGTVLAGYADDGQGVIRSFRWTQSTGMQAIPLSPGWADAWAQAISANGNVIVGYGYRPAADGNRAFRWTAETGMQDLGALPCDVHSYAQAVNDDGSVIVGVSGSRSFVWTEGSGLVDLARVLAAKGVDTGSWQLSNAAGISFDGGTIVGDGVLNGSVSRGWLISGLGALPCSPADIATEGSLEPLTSGPDGFITGTDFDVFVESFFRVLQLSNGYLIADLTDNSGLCAPDGFVTGADFDFFLVRFFQGC